MTKVTIIGQGPTESKKPIEFVKRINIEGNPVEANHKPSHFMNIEVRLTGEGCYDFFFAYEINKSLPTVFLGHFNDGVVE